MGELGKVDAVAQAIENGEISHMLCVGVDLGEYEAIKKIKAKNPENVFLAIGEHPLNDNLDKVDWQKLRDLVANDKEIIAIGETGFDFQGDFKVQNEAFDIHAQLALDHSLSIILHTRNSDQQAADALKRWKDVRGVLHCYTGSVELAKLAIDHGWKVSFSGILTYKNAEDIRTLAKALPIESLLIETDAPYLAPQVVRGKMNTPLYVKYIGEFLANLLGMEQNDLAKILRDNFFDLFKERK